MTTLINASENLGKAIRSARRVLGLTQPQLAMAAGFGVRFVVELEVGKPTALLENILRVLQALGGTLMVEGLDDAGAANGDQP